MTWLRTPPKTQPETPDAGQAGQGGGAAPGGQGGAAPGGQGGAAPGGQGGAALGRHDGAVALDGRRSAHRGAQAVADDSQEPAGGPAGARSPALRLGVLGWLRWGWRQLTSMRTALILLFLLAAGSVPGSLLPQESTNPAGVSQYYLSHPLLARLLGGLSLFNVFGAPWFAAVYILLFTSLVGCVLPRTLRLVGSARQPPPRAPSNLGKLPFSVSYAAALAPQQALDAAAKALSARHFRLRTGPGWVSAEKGYLREVGNLLFHMALLGLLVSIGLGGLFGYKADRLLVTGTSFANTVTALDEFHPGRLVGPQDLQPFTVSLEHFSASYVTSGPLVGQPSSFTAAVRYSDSPQSPMRSYSLTVNHPLVVDGVRVFLIGHGYAPTFRVTDGAGQVVFDGAVPFIPVETSGLTSEGAIKVPDAQPQQLGFAGVFLPSAIDLNGRLESFFPGPDNPMVSLVSYAGNLGMNSGPPQSVYTLDTAGLHELPIAPRPLAVGQSMRLPDGLGTLTYTGYQQWVSLAITYDPGQTPALVSGIVVLAGLLLSFMVRRRRVFVRATAGEAGGTLVELGGLTRSDAAGGFEEEFSALTAEISGLHQARPDSGQEPASSGSSGTDPEHAGPAGAAAQDAGQRGARADTSGVPDAGSTEPNPTDPESTAGE
jgi:cytochrome c biogenesis protein